MKATLSSKPTSDTRIILVLKADKKAAVKDFEAGKGSVTVRYKGGKTFIYCGLGEKKDCTAQSVRAAAAVGARKACELKRKTVSVCAPSAPCDTQSCAKACLEGTVLGSYAFSKFKTEKPRSLGAIELVTKALSPDDLGLTMTLCECTCYARDLVNDNASAITPKALAEEAARIAGRTSIKLKVLDEKAIQKEGLSLLWAVGQGSPYPPRLAILEYEGNRGSKERIAVVGKGITFDSGGQNLKPTGHIETMRCDMAGAAAVLGLMKALAALKPAVNVVGVIPSAHNAVGSKAFFPGDIYKSFSGKTVEITCTDAEGRLVLADAFEYVRKHHKPTEIIDLSTLTGSVLIALGETVAGLMSSDDGLAAKLFEAGEKSGERLWRLPVYEEHSESMKSDMADLRNTSKLKKGFAGSITGAAFLKEFAGKLPWAHIDIAGTAFNESEERGEVPKYGTGFGVRLLWEYLAGK